MSPRVTLGVATYERDTYLAEAVASCLHQTYDDLEVLVVARRRLATRTSSGSSRGFDDPRLRIVRHERNRGIAEAYNTIIREGRGELIAMLGDDDVCEPDRIARQVAVFDRHPDTGVAHGAASIIDGQGVQRGTWPSQDRAPPRAAAPPRARAQHARRPVAHGPPPRLRGRRRLRPATSASPRTSTSGCAPCAPSASATSPAARSSACAATATTSPTSRRRRSRSRRSQNALRSLDRRRAAARARARARLGRHAPRRRRAPRARGAGRRLRAPRRCRCPAWPASCASAPRACPPPPRPQPNGRKIVLTSFGFNDSGGGTTVPRVAAKELARRGWDVTVFHAATRPDPSGEPYAVREWDEDGVRLVGVHNRQHGLWDLGNPLRELDDPPITQAFGALLDRVRPTSCTSTTSTTSAPRCIDEAAARGLPSYFSTHNYWLICPRAYLLTGDGRDLRRPRRPRPRLRLLRRRAARHRRPPAAPGGHPRPRSRAASPCCLAVSDAMRAHARRPGLPGRDDRRRPPGRARRRRGLGAARARPARPAAAASA